MREPQIPGVRLVGELGRGAHSVVYRGEHECGPCAVKVPQTRARWTRWIYREAVALARVRHDALPEVFEVGVVDQLPFLVIELVEGETLADRLRSGRPLPVGEVIALARQLASVLAAVHDVGLVHRDVKPRNIVVGQAGMLKLVDFGFTTPMERSGNGDTAGTAAYAAPEQLVPPGRVDGRSDLFGVGRILLECLLGADFHGEARRRSREVRAELRRRQVPDGLASIVADLVEPELDRRYPDARALESDLELLRLGHPVRGAALYRHEAWRPATTARAKELAHVLHALEARRDGGVVLVHGARGSGKSLLLASIEDRLAGVDWVTRVVCAQDEAPLTALRRLLESTWCEVSRDGLSTSELREVLGNLARVGALISPRLARALEVEETLGHDEAHEATDALAEGAAEILLRIARRRGRSLLVIDDLQWLDSASAEALVRVAHRVREVDLTVLVGSRSEEAPGPLERFLSLREVEVPVTEVRLSRLTDDAVAALVGSHLNVTDVDPLLASRIAAMADGTPLGVLEVLGAFLDGGALRPHARNWRFDPELLDRAALPTGTVALLGRRLADIPAATRRVLEVAAVCGTSFREGRVAAVLDVTTETVGYATVTAQRAGVIEPTSGDTYRFLHDSLRETLLEGLAGPDARALHQRLGELLAGQPDAGFAELCEAAHHLAAGEPDRDPALVYRVATAAAKAAAAHFDDEAALAFLAQASAAASRAGIEVVAELHACAGDALLRLASVSESIQAFERALAVTRAPLERAALHERISWAYRAESEPDRAWEALGRAFAELGERLPAEDVASTVRTTTQLARSRFGRLGGRSEHRTAAEIDMLCRLHYQNGRLAFEYGRAARLVQSSLVANALSAETESLAIRAKARGHHASTVAIFGRPAAGISQAEEALELARRSGEQTAVALCTLMLAMTSVIAGDLDRGARAFTELVELHGPWTDLHEYTLQAMSGAMIASNRGRCAEAWSWLGRAAARARRSRTSPRTLVPFVHRARAALASLEQDAEPGSWLAHQLERIGVEDGGRGYHRITSWGPRAMYFLHRGDFGADLERLVREFNAERISPRAANIATLEYFVAIGHVRLRQCMAAPIAEREPHLRALERANDDVRAGARIGIVKAHAALLDAAVAWLRGTSRKAEKLLAQAELFATRDNVVWIIADVARIRAHMLRAAGKESAAHDQSRIAESVALQHGAVSHARVIRRELGLPGADAPVAEAPSRSSHRSSRAAKQLAVLLQIARGARRDVKAEELAATILDELLGSIGADRAALWFQPETPSLGVAVARHRSSTASISITPESPLGALLRTVHQTGVPWTQPPRDESGVVLQDLDPSRMLIVPLHLYEQPVGALAVERAPSDPPFAAEDEPLLEMLAHQVPITLELARLLSEREKLQTSLQQAQKLEAIGQLAGGLAHDFNNMLAAMKVAVGIAQERAGDDEDMLAELDIIAQATSRASLLTSQLLTFSRSQPLPLQVHDVNQLIVSLEPMLRRVATSAVELKLSLSPIVDAVSIDAASFDQALMNLLINARDAMPKGGTFSISTRNVNLDEGTALRVNVKPGSYVEVEVADTGEGMNPETLNRIFEPFFTTKAPGRGTGLGLATVYGFVKNCGGGIEVSSEVGAGTRFTIYLKRTERARVGGRRSSAVPATASAAGICDTILVVDDDDLVRRSIAKILERNGYRVVAASGSAEALDVARSPQGKRIGLVIMDVLLPGVTGPELGRRLKEVMPAQILFVSGFSADSAPIEDAKVKPEMLLQKPFTQATLLARVRELLQLTPP